MKKIDQYHPDKCRDILLALDLIWEEEEISLKDANKRILSHDTYALIDVPSFDKSPYDGYAFRGEDTLGASKENPVILEIIEEIPAGYMPKKSIGPGQAVKILTGGPLPQGANVCYKKEKTTFTQTHVSIYEEISPNKDIIPRGEDRVKGDLLAQAGSKIGPGLIGILASQGMERIRVFKKPLVGLVATGDELLVPGQPMVPGKIYESNLETLGSIFENIGYEVKSYGLAEDKPQAIARILTQAKEDCDLIVTTGGASVGDYDYAIAAVEEAGGQVLFWKTSMKPGGSIVVSQLADVTVLGLSGNPAAAILSLYRVCLPYIYKLTGRRDIFPEPIDMTLLDGFDRPSPGLRLLRGQMVYKDSVVYFKENPHQGNGVLSSFVDCDAFLEIPMGSGPMPAGSVLKGYRVGHIFGSLGD